MKIVDLPEIRIKYGFLLAENTTTPMMDYYDKGGTLRSFEEYEAIAAQYTEWWKPYEDKILSAMHDVTGLVFKQNVINVYVAPFFYAFSEPLVLGVQFDSQEKLVCNLTHELIHRLLMDNTTHDDTKSYEEWTSMFGVHNPVTLIHIPVHAIMHEIFIDKIVTPEFLEQEVLGSGDYRESWDYVRQHSYLEITKKLRDLYEVN